jgi:hypothetical protein
MPGENIPTYALYQRVAVKIWADERFHRLKNDERLFFIYLLSNPHRTLVGFYVLPLKYASADLGWEMSTVRRCMQVLTKARLIDYDFDTSAVLLLNSLKYQSPENNEKGIKGALSRILRMPKTRLIKRFLELARVHCPKTKFLQDLERLFEPPSQQILEDPFKLSDLISPTSDLKPQISNHKHVGEGEEKRVGKGEERGDGSVGNVGNGRVQESNAEPVRKSCAEFETFYRAYPKHVDRKDALDAWEELQPDDKLLALILSKLEQYKKTPAWEKDSGRYIPSPGRWLRDQRWLDDLSPKRRRLVV